MARRNTGEKTHDRAANCSTNFSSAFEQPYCNSNTLQWNEQLQLYMEERFEHEKNEIYQYS